MKKRKILAVLGAVLIAAAAPMVAEADRPSAPIQMESRVYPMVLPRGGTIPLSAEYFEMRLGLPAGEIAAITIVSLPVQGSGRLMLDGVEVQVHDTIFRSELDRLCYVQDEGALAASSGWFSFIPLCRSELNKNMCDLSATGGGRDWASDCAGCVLSDRAENTGVRGAGAAEGQGGIHGEPEALAGQGRANRRPVPLYTERGCQRNRPLCSGRLGRAGQGLRADSGGDCGANQIKAEECSGLEHSSAA